MKKAEVIIGLILGTVVGIIAGLAFSLMSMDASSLEEDQTVDTTEEYLEDLEEYLVEEELNIQENMLEDANVSNVSDMNVINIPVRKLEPVQSPSEDINLMSDETTGRGDSSDGIIQAPRPITNIRQEIIQTNNPSDGLGEPEFIEPLAIPTVNPSEDVLVKTKQGGMDGGETIWTEFVH